MIKQIIQHEVVLPTLAQKEELCGYFEVDNLEELYMEIYK